MMGLMTTPLYCQGRLAESMSELTPYHRMIEAVETAGLRMDGYRGSCDGPEATHGLRMDGYRGSCDGPEATHGNLKLQRDHSLRHSRSRYQRIQHQSTKLG